MNLSYEEWVTINARDDMTNEILDQAILDLGKTIDSLDIIQGEGKPCCLAIEHLHGKLDRLLKIRRVRNQEPWRPWMSTKMTIEFKDGTVEFQGLPNGPWSVPASEKTKRLGELLTEIYQETKSVKVEY